MLELFEAVIWTGLPSNWQEMDARIVDSMTLLYSEFRKEALACTRKA